MSPIAATSPVATVDIYAGNGQEPPDGWAFEATLGDLAIKELKIFGKPIEFADVSANRLSLISREASAALTRLDRRRRKGRHVGNAARDAHAELNGPRF